MNIILYWFPCGIKPAIFLLQAQCSTNRATCDSDYAVRTAPSSLGALQFTRVLILLDVPSHLPHGSSLELKQQRTAVTTLARKRTLSSLSLYSKGLRRGEHGEDLEEDVTYR